MNASKFVLPLMAALGLVSAQAKAQGAPIQPVGICEVEISIYDFAGVKNLATTIGTGTGVISCQYYSGAKEIVKVQAQTIGLGGPFGGTAVMQGKIKSSRFYVTVPGAAQFIMSYDLYRTSQFSKILGPDRGIKYDMVSGQVVIPARFRLAVGLGAETGADVAQLNLWPLEAVLPAPPPIVAPQPQPEPQPLPPEPIKPSKPKPQQPTAPQPPSNKKPSPVPPAPPEVQQPPVDQGQFGPANGINNGNGAVPVPVED